MKTNTLRWLAVSATTGAAVLCWNLFREEGAPASRPLTRPFAATHRVLAKLSAPNPASLWPELATPEFKRTILERGQSWLASRGRDAAGLIAMWDLTGDYALLAEAAEKFPDDPRVCMAMIQQAAEEAQKAMPWIERLILAEPTNPEGLYLKVWILMTANDRAGAIAALRKAGGMSGQRNDYLRHRMQTVREAALASGSSPGDAARLAIAPSLEKKTRSQSLGSAVYATNLEIGEVKTAGSEDRLLEITGIGLATAEKFSSGGAVSILDTITARNHETRMLEGLPRDTEIGENGRSAVVLLGEANLRREYVGNALALYKAVPALLSVANDDAVIIYANCFQENGEYEAVAWLLQQPAQSDAGQ
jgi:hypothetical protein